MKMNKLNQRGADAIEYALMIAAIAAVVVTVTYFIKLDRRSDVVIESAVDKATAAENAPAEPEKP